jgi:hypothetical protein
MADDEAPQSPWCLPALFSYPQLIHTPPQVESLMRCFCFKRQAPLFGCFLTQAMCRKLARVRVSPTALKSLAGNAFFLK